jgi:2-hydroxychromene-2-carboxylate isomerase
VQTLTALLRSLNQDADRCLRDAQDESTRQAYRANTDRARQLGMFGSPTFVVGEEIFWGHDRLEDAIDWAKAG